MLQERSWVGVDAIITDIDGKILLIKRSTNSKSYPNYWGLVGGWIESGETVVEALKREAQEEIGVTIEVIKFTGKYYDSCGIHPTKTRVALPHLCKITSGQPKVAQISEVQEVKWFTSEEILELDLAYDHKKMLIDCGVISGKN